MEELQIERNIDNRRSTITLTDGELEKAYRIMERRYLDEDFANALADAAQDPDTRFHSGHRSCRTGSAHISMASLMPT